MPIIIVFALVDMGKLPGRLAIGTGLTISAIKAAIKAAVGFAKYEHYLPKQGPTAIRQTYQADD